MYRWSSYRANGRGEVDSLIPTQHAIYKALGRRTQERVNAYRVLSDVGAFIQLIRGAIKKAYETGTPLGNGLLPGKGRAKALLSK